MNLDLREIPFYYINLDDAVERRERTESQLKELGIKHVTRIEAIRHEYGAAGTPRSMLAALKLARTIPYGKPFVLFLYITPFTAIEISFLSNNSFNSFSLNVPLTLSLTRRE